MEKENNTRLEKKQEELKSIEDVCKEKAKDKLDQKQELTQKLEQVNEEILELEEKLRLKKLE